MGATAAQCTGSLTIDAGSTLNTTSNTLTILGNVVINGAISLGGEVKVKGNWTIAGAQTNNAKTITFNGTTTQTITGGANFSNLVINNAGGVSTGSLSINGTITLASGSLTVSPGQVLSLGTTGTVTGETSGNYIIGAVSATSTITTGAANIAGLGISIEPNGNNLGATTITRISGAGGLVTFEGSSSIKRRWKITPATQPSSDVSITFAWVSDDDNSATLATMYVWKSDDDGASWYLLAGPVDGSARSVVFATSGFSDFTLAGADNPLPVELAAFSAAQSEKQIVLNWKTASEFNSARFEIEKKAAGTDIWHKQGEVNGAGNSNSPRHYSFTDRMLKAGTYVYRLKMIDNDGMYSYSAEVQTVVASPQNFGLAQNYPNPFNPTTAITYQIPVAGRVTIGLYAVTGQLIKTLVDENKDAGYYSVNINGAGLSSGTYFYKLEAGPYSEIKKMIFLK